MYPGVSSGVLAQRCVSIIFFFSSDATVDVANSIIADLFEFISLASDSTFFAMLKISSFLFYS